MMLFAHSEQQNTSIVFGIIHCPMSYPIAPSAIAHRLHKSQNWMNFGQFS